ncbi:MAG: hypothetical protein ABW185_19585 [Sedimenticola sp.]
MFSPPEGRRAYAGNQAAIKSRLAGIRQIIIPDRREIDAHSPTHSFPRRTPHPPGRGRH